MDLSVEPGAVVVVAGIPGAGKTTLIDRVVDPAESEIVDIERRRRAGHISRFNAVRVAGHYRRILAAVVLHRDVMVVVHSRGTSVFARRLISVLARARRRPAYLVLLVAPAAEAVDGQLTRGRTIPAEQMEGHIDRFADLVSEHDAIARREGWASVTVLDRDAASGVGRIGPAPQPAEVRASRSASPQAPPPGA